MTDLPRAALVDEGKLTGDLGWPILWALLVTVIVATATGLWTAYHAKSALERFGLEALALGAVTKSYVIVRATNCAAGVLITLAVVLLHRRRLALAAARQLALRLALLLPLFSLIAAASMFGASYSVAVDHSLRGLTGAADLLVGGISLLLQAPLLGCVIVFAARYLRFAGGWLGFVAKLAVTSLVYGLAWMALQWLLWQTLFAHVVS